MFTREITIIIILIFWKLGSVGPVQQKIKLPSPKLCFAKKKPKTFAKEPVVWKCFPGQYSPLGKYHKIGELNMLWNTMNSPLQRWSI